MAAWGDACLRLTESSIVKIHILGSAAGGGFPQWNCNCANCCACRARHPDYLPRTQSSITVSADGEHWLLFNASPDIRQQLSRVPALQPARRLRDSGVSAVLLMDAQIDHVTGLFMLRENASPLPVWCHELVRADLQDGNPVFNVLSHYCGVDWQPLTLESGGWFPRQVPGLHLRALPLISNAPPYSPHRDQPQVGDNIGVTVTDALSQKRLFYAPGLGQMTPSVWQAMQEADVVLVDGTLWSDDEMIALGASRKTARAMGHLPLSGPEGMLGWLTKLPANTRKLLIHINNTNPILNQASPERAELQDLGIEVAYDGLEIDL